LPHNWRGDSEKISQFDKLALYFSPELGYCCVHIMALTLSRFIRDDVIHLEGVKKHVTRRGSCLVTSDNLSDSVWFVDSGLIKLLRSRSGDKDVLVGLVTPGQVFGEEGLFHVPKRDMTAEVLLEGVVYEIPRNTFRLVFDAKPEYWRALARWLVDRQSFLEDRVLMLCHCDMALRILFCLSSLGPIVAGSGTNGTGYSLALSQSEIAGMVGATRETTSTLLNIMQRAGLVKLGRCLLVVPSVDAINAEIERRTAGEAAAAGA
jgi:CRP-like cAMP-binding protein